MCVDAEGEGGEGQIGDWGCGSSDYGYLAVDAQNGDVVDRFDSS